MNKEPKVCVDRILPEDQLVKAADRSVKENPANVPLFRFRAGLGVAPLEPSRIAILTGKKWENGRTLRVNFMDGDPGVQSKVEQFAHQWSQFANIKFIFGSNPNAEIRVSFKDRGSWSYIGTDALSIDKSKPTMNYGWLTPTTSDNEYSRVVLHEFDHSLGCIHEHQHPEAGIPWDNEAVYRYYMGPPNNWTKEKVDINIFQKYNRDITNFSKFDRDSIMLYAIPNTLTIGDFEVGWNRVLSATDKEFMGTMYPFETKTITELIVDASSTKASIGKHGEQDFFKFDAKTTGVYTIKTNGETDVVMTLLGPNSQTSVIAFDDDSGEEFNAKIVKKLDPGTFSRRVPGITESQFNSSSDVDAVFSVRFGLFGFPTTCNDLLINVRSI